MTDIAADLLVYHDMTDTINHELPRLGQNAGDWYGPAFEGLYVVAVGPSIHLPKKATIVLAAEHRPERLQALEAWVTRGIHPTDQPVKETPTDAM
jgi:hypothetical protein